MKNKSTKEKMRSPLDELLDEISPLEQKKTDSRMLLAARIYDAMRAKGWNNNDLMKALGRNTPSIITKWLSGTHNFTTDTLVELEAVLGISLLNLRPERHKISTFTIAVSQSAVDTQPTSFERFFTKSNKRNKPDNTSIHYNANSKEPVVYA